MGVESDPGGELRAARRGRFFSAVTWQSHSLANGALVLAATGRLDVTLAAIATATLPDQIERLAPWMRHRGASHWLGLWLLVLAATPAAAQRLLAGHGGLLANFTRLAPHWRGAGLVAGAILFGLVLGPLLHVLLDGCSSAGVPVLPFSRARFRLALYRTGAARNRRWNPSELLFLTCLLGASAFLWQARWR